MRLGKQSRELFDLLSGQAAGKVSQVPRDNLAENADGIEFRVTLPTLETQAVMHHPATIRSPI